MDMKHLLLGAFFFIVFCTSVSSKPLIRDKRAFSYIANQTVCVVDHVVYHDGDPIPTDDPCETCKCRPPGFSCVLRECEIKPGCKAIRRDGECCPEYQCGCEHNGRFFNDGDRIPNAESPCYTCFCQGSSITCALADCKFRFDCEPEYVPGECCPRYDHCPPEPTEPTTTKLTSVWTTSAAPTTLILTTSSPVLNFTEPITTVVPIETTQAPEVRLPATTTLLPAIAEEPIATTVAAVEDLTTVKSSEEGEDSLPLELATTLAPLREPEVVSNESTVTTVLSIEVVPTTEAAIEVAETVAPVVENDDIQEPTISNEIDIKPVQDDEVTVSPAIESEVATLPIDASSEPQVTTRSPVDGEYESKMATVTVVAETFPTTISWVPNTDLVAEHKEADFDDLIITTQMPPILGDFLEGTERINDRIELEPEAITNASVLNNSTKVEEVDQSATTVSVPKEVVVTETILVEGADSNNIIDSSLEIL